MWTRHPAADGVRGAMRILPRLTLTLETYTETWDLFPAGLILWVWIIHRIYPFVVLMWESAPTI